MSKTQLVQTLYDHLRLVPVFAGVVNFFTTRERVYRARSQEAVDNALSDIGAADGGSISAQAGIFKGMRWPGSVVVGSEFAPKVLGTYEIEIQNVFRKFLMDESPSCFVDVGAAEGYYAIGAAMLRPSLKVLAYERNKHAHPSIAALAALNGVSQQVHLCSEFDLAKFDENSFGARPLLLVDIEGGEAEVINRNFVHCFRNALILVEIHDFIAPGTGRRLRSLLLPTHAVWTIRYKRNLRNGLRRGSHLSRLDWLLATDEKRPCGNYWLVAKPRSRS